MPPRPVPHVCRACSRSLLFGPPATSTSSSVPILLEPVALVRDMGAASPPGVRRLQADHSSFPQKPPNSPSVRSCVWCLTSVAFTEVPCSREPDCTASVMASAVSYDDRCLSCERLWGFCRRMSIDVYQAWYRTGIIWLALAKFTEVVAMVE